MVAIERLDDDGLLDLSQRTDTLGVLSVYVDADPSKTRTCKPPQST